MTRGLKEPLRILKLWPLTLGANFCRGGGGDCSYTTLGGCSESLAMSTIHLCVQHMCMRVKFIFQLATKKLSLWKNYFKKLLGSKLKMIPSFSQHFLETYIVAIHNEPEIL